MESHRDVRQELSSAGQCKVERCSCGVLHLTVGALTVRLSADIVFELLAVLDRAAAQLAPAPLLGGFCASDRSRTPSS